MKRDYVVYLFIVMSFSVVCMMASVVFAQDKVISLRYAGVMPSGDPMSVIEEEWCREVEKRTDGNVKIRYFPAATLSSWFQMYDNTMKGIVDIGSISPGMTQGRFPQMQGLADMPFEYANNKVIAKAVNQFYAKFKPKEFDDVAIMYFTALPPPILLLAEKPWVKIEDLKGVKVRAMGVSGRIMSELGAIPVAMQMSEVYDAASKGMLKAMVSPYLAMKQFRMADIMKYATEFKGSCMVSYWLIAMNKSKWNSITAKNRQIIEEINREWADKHSEVAASLEKDAKAYAISRGTKVNTLSAEENAKWLAMAHSEFDKYVAKMKENNFPAEEAIKFVQDIVKQYE